MLYEVLEVEVIIYLKKNYFYLLIIVFRKSNRIILTIVFSNIKDHTRISVHSRILLVQIWISQFIQVDIQSLIDIGF